MDFAGSGAPLDAQGFAHLDSAITKLRKAADMLAAATTHSTDTDENGRLLTDTTGRYIDIKAVGGTPGRNALRQYKALEAPMVDMIESALEVAVNPAALDWDWDPPPEKTPVSP